MAIQGTPRLAANSRVRGYDVRLQARALINDIYTFKAGLYNRENKEWPEDAVRMLVQGNTAPTTTITLLEKLRTAGVYGNTPAVGTEESPRTKSLTLYQNNYRKVINQPGYGIRELEDANYKLYDEHEKNLGDWNREEHGYEIRKALVERYGANLLAGDTATVATAWWNSNVYIPTAGPAIANQPVFSTNRGTHTNNIVTGLLNNGGLGQNAQRTVTAPVLEDLSNFALAKRIVPIKHGSLPTGEGYILAVSELQAAFLSNPTYVNNNLGALWIAYSRLPKDIQMWPGVIGCYNNIVIVTDNRAPTLLPAGSAAPYSLTAGYMVWDSTDNRNRGATNIKDVGMLLGMAAIAEVEGQKLHWIADDRDYKFHQGLGTAGVRGCQLPLYIDEDTNEVLNQNSIMCIFDLPNGGGLATLT